MPSPGCTRSETTPSSRKTSTWACLTDGDDKVRKFGEWLWRQRSREGRTMLELLNYVVWGNGSVSARLWNAIRSDDWAIPHIGLSSLGEIVGWARPDEFPPRNMRTSKGLRALGYNARIGV